MPAACATRNPALKTAALPDNNSPHGHPRNKFPGNPPDRAARDRLLCALALRMVRICIPGMDSRHRVRTHRALENTRGGKFAGRQLRGVRSGDFLHRPRALRRDAGFIPGVFRHGGASKRASYATDPNPASFASAPLASRHWFRVNETGPRLSSNPGLAHPSLRTGRCCRIEVGAVKRTLVDPGSRVTDSPGIRCAKEERQPGICQQYLSGIPPI